MLKRGSLFKNVEDMLANFRQSWQILPINQSPDLPSKFTEALPVDAIPNLNLYFPAEISQTVSR